MPETMTVEKAVKNRYSEAAKAQEPALCCPVDYNREYLDVIPQEIIDRDYGCGDPSTYLRPGETVLDLGCGGGKICYIASQVVGAEGKVIGVDMNDDMLSLAERYREEVGDRIGYRNVSFRKGRIQDLALDYRKVEAYLEKHPIRNAANLDAFESWIENERRSHPMIPTASIDVVVSNCVLNLVRPEDKRGLFAEMFRVLKKGGRIVVSDIVSDEDVPEHLQNGSRAVERVHLGILSEKTSS